MKWWKDWVVWGFIAFFVILFALMHHLEAKHVAKEEACVSRGGVPITTRKETLCVKGIEKI